MPRIPVIVASHTHWDRGWYLPFQMFRVVLVEMFDFLLDTLKKDPDFRVFNYDGQTVVLEDYLAVRPEKRQEVDDLIRRGRLVVGPWYTQPDEYLVSGEAIIRNLAAGMAMARDHGAKAADFDAGYLPDTFGHISQLPQIFRGCGLDSLIYSRGTPRQWLEFGTCFRWVAPDGKSWVYALPQRPGDYGNASFLTWKFARWERAAKPWNETRKRVEDLLKGFEEVGHPGVVLFNNGMDHQPVEPGVPKALERLNRELTGYKFIHGTFADYVRLVRKQAAGKKPPKAAGEMRDVATTPSMIGVFSSRMYLKQANAATQAALERLAEPLSAAGWRAGDVSHSRDLAHAWKKLMKNHAHDDICGCSVDSVHRDMQTRFRNVNEAIDAISVRALAWIAHRSRRPKGLPVQRAAVFNGLPRPRKVLLSAEFLCDDSKPGRIILDDRGQAVPTFAGARREITKKVWDLDLWCDVQRTLHLQQFTWLAELPACGYAQFGPGWSARPAADKAGMKASSNSIENELLRVTMDRNGSVSIFDKKTKQRVAGGNIFEDDADAGSEYDWSGVPDDVAITSERAKGAVKTKVLGNIAAEVTCEMTLRVPPAITDDRKARVNQKVDLPIRTTARLIAGSRRVEFTTTVSNSAKDHRLRVAFPTGLRSETVTVAEHFDVLSRPVEFPSGEPVKNREPQHTHHCDEFISVCEGPRGVTLLNRGLPEYEARYEGKKVTFVQTLLRCVGGVGAGANLPAPEAQCPGEHTFHYALILHKGSAETAQVWNDATEYTTPAFRHMLEEKDDGTEPTRGSLFRVEDPRVAVSAIKESRGGFLLRLWNPSSRPVKPIVRTGFDIAAAAITDMLEQPQGKLAFEARRVKLASLAPKEIVTLWLRPAKRGPHPVSPYGRPDQPAGFRCL